MFSMAATLVRMCGEKLLPLMTGAVTARPPFAVSPTLSKTAPLKALSKPGAANSSTSAPPVELKKTSRSGYDPGAGKLNVLKVSTAPLLVAGKDALKLPTVRPNPSLLLTPNVHGPADGILTVAVHSRTMLSTSDPFMPGG